MILNCPPEMTGWNGTQKLISFGKYLFSKIYAIFLEKYSNNNKNTEFKRMEDIFNNKRSNNQGENWA